MMDQIFDRTYQSGRAELNSGLDRLFRRAGAAGREAFQVLNRIEFSAPWLERKQGARCG
jgi:hypothetical protein